MHQDQPKPSNVQASESHGTIEERQHERSGQTTGLSDSPQEVLLTTSDTEAHLQLEGKKMDTSSEDNENKEMTAPPTPAEGTDPSAAPTVSLADVAGRMDKEDGEVGVPPSTDSPASTDPPADTVPEDNLNEHGSQEPNHDEIPAEQEKNTEVPAVGTDGDTSQTETDQPAAPKTPAGCIESKNQTPRSGRLSLSERKSATSLRESVRTEGSTAKGPTMESASARSKNKSSGEYDNLQRNSSRGSNRSTGTPNQDERPPSGMRDNRGSIRGEALNSRSSQRSVDQSQTGRKSVDQLQMDRKSVDQSQTGRKSADQSQRSSVRSRDQDSRSSQRQKPRTPQGSTKSLTDTTHGGKLTPRVASREGSRGVSREGSRVASCEGSRAVSRVGSSFQQETNSRKVPTFDDAADDAEEAHHDKVDPQPTAKNVAASIEAAEVADADILAPTTADADKAAEVSEPAGPNIDQIRTDSFNPEVDRELSSSRGDKSNPDGGVPLFEASQQNENELGLVASKEHSLHGSENAQITDKRAPKSRTITPEIQHEEEDPQNTSNQEPSVRNLGNDDTESALQPQVVASQPARVEMTEQEYYYYDDTRTYYTSSYGEMTPPPTPK